MPTIGFDKLTRIRLQRLLADRGNFRTAFNVHRRDSAKLHVDSRTGFAQNSLQHVGNVSHSVNTAQFCPNLHPEVGGQKRCRRSGR